MRISDWSSDVCSSDLAGGRLLSRKTGEIIPVPIIFSRVGFAEIPAPRAVRGLGRRPIASRATPFPVAQPHLRCAALPIIGAQTGRTPVIAAGRWAHDGERKRVVWGTRWCVRVIPGGPANIKTTTEREKTKS